MKDTIKVEGLTFVRAPAHENRQGRWELHDYHRGQALSIRLDTYGKNVQCTIDVGPCNDVLRLRKFAVSILRRSRRAALVDALQLAHSTLKLCELSALTSKLIAKGAP